jgi:uncharacterized LabA/DUF88 family protein
MTIYWRTSACSCGYWVSSQNVFKKDKQGRKTKGVDITLTRDMLSHAFRGNYDVARLIAGDGDYLPLIEEVKRLGKRVQVCFFDMSVQR